MTRLLLVAPLVFAAACQGVTIDPAGNPDDAIVRWTRTTIVGNGAGQAPTVTEEWIGADTRSTDGIDPNCATSSGRLWAGNGFTSAELCFSGTGDFALSDYKYYICSRYTCFQVSWSKNVHSIKTGDIFGMLYAGSYPSFTCQDVVNPHQQIAIQDSCMKMAERYDQGLTGIP